LPSAVEAAEETVEGLKRRVERPKHQRSTSNVMVEE